MAFILALLIMLVIYFVIIASNDKAYSFLFERKQWNLWEQYIKNIDKFVFIDEECGRRKYVWKDQFGNVRYTAYVFIRDEVCIIAHENNLIATTDDYYHSEIMAHLLLTK